MLQLSSQSVEQRTEKLITEAILVLMYHMVERANYIVSKSMIFTFQYKWICSATNGIIYIAFSVNQVELKDKTKLTNIAHKISCCLKMKKLADHPQTLLILKQCLWVICHFIQSYSQIVNTDYSYSSYSKSPKFNHSQMLKNSHSYSE